VPSKKQSAARPRDETVFFIDRSLRTGLFNAGLVVEIHDDRFARAEEDRIWLRTVGERGWVVLTEGSEGAIPSVGDRRAASQQGQARVFVLTAGNLRGTEIAAVFMAALPRICSALNCVRDRSSPVFHNPGYVTVT